MKIAVASEKDKEDANVSTAAGRAPYFLLFEDGTLAKTMKNPFAVGGGGAGFGVAHMLDDEGVELVIGGRFGPNMLGALDEKGIQHREVQDKSVKEAVEELAR